MNRPGAPGTWQRELWRAFAFAGSRRWGLLPPYHAQGYLILQAEPRMPWGRSTHSSGYLSHAVGMLTTAWRGGVYAGAAMRWRCGAQTFHFRLEAEPSGPLCPLCLIPRTRREKRRS